MPEELLIAYHGGSPRNKYNLHKLKDNTNGKGQLQDNLYFAKNFAEVVGYLIDNPDDIHPKKLCIEGKDIPEEEKSTMSKLVEKLFGIDESNIEINNL
jgi:hypothetical protein